ncbi:helix-turn-helix domain-containing protein [Actinomyces capricornis]|uniref:HTH cro/C1-type domain-containing protein n=1 Tax=Actinomyces capricornis TaxID=2755559 RepID=A0ABM7U7T1_9ACTO|nr:helix-turn-helix transcriptional regulator [Actinomyces capricornis]BDA63560.1 hypothetical protein MANAM107_03940 [Actinomyces capricornis]
MARFRVEDAPALVRAVHIDAGLQAELAGRAGVAQPSIAQIERGRRTVSPEMLGHILEVADYRPLLALKVLAERIREIAGIHGLENLRVFGPALTGSDGYRSDIGPFFTPHEGVDLFDAALFSQEAEELTRFSGDAVSGRSTTAQRGVLADPLYEDVAL